MTARDSLGDRMKRYEDVTRSRLTPRMPVLIRIDGKAFHTLTAKCDKPFDHFFQSCMWNAARYLCERIQGARFAYCQSDEISLLLVDYEALNTSGWFDHDLRKIVSVSAATATMGFVRSWGIAGDPVFDSRAWNIPREEVANYFVWRQQDAVRNSIQALAQAHFSQKQLHGLSCDLMQEKLWQEKAINWSDQPIAQKRGACWRWLPTGESAGEGERARHAWAFDGEPPTFTADRQYVERFVFPEVPSC